MSEFLTSSVQETEQLGERFAKKLKGGDVVALYGDLGSGKTTFVQGLARGLGIKRRIISPTFIIIRRYELKAQSSKRKTTRFAARRAAQSVKRFYHIDLYRMEGYEDIAGLGLEEIVEDQEGVVAIEWAEKIGDLLSKRRWDIHFAYLSEKERKIRKSYKTIDR